LCNPNTPPQSTCVVKGKHLDFKQTTECLWSFVPLSPSNPSSLKPRARHQHHRQGAKYTKYSSPPCRSPPYAPGSLCSRHERQHTQSRVLCLPSAPAFTNGSERGRCDGKYTHITGPQGFVSEVVIFPRTKHVCLGGIPGHVE
jgi:hypothetical protein